jgi:hypothetical protein
MANLIRSAKPCSDWGDYELMAYNITVIAQSPEIFFRGNSAQSLDDIDPSLINSTVYVEDVADDTFQYLTYLDLAINGGRESFIDDFARETLRILGFEERGLALTMHHTISLTNSGVDNHTTSAQPDVCLVARLGRPMILLILQEDKSIFRPSQPGAQVIAGAIAAYQSNNLKRSEIRLPKLHAMTIPCITMNGTRPTFYLVPVTRALSTAVATGQYPEAQTKVVKCVTTLGPDHPLTEGMEEPEYRRVAFQHFMAFKSLAKEYWQTFLV